LFGLDVLEGEADRDKVEALASQLSIEVEKIVSLGKATSNLLWFVSPFFGMDVILCNFIREFAKSGQKDPRVMTDILTQLNLTAGVIEIFVKVFSISKCQLCDLICQAFRFTKKI
jgi:hypothetical protein